MKAFMRCAIAFALCVFIGVKQGYCQRAIGFAYTVIDGLTVVDGANIAKARRDGERYRDAVELYAARGEYETFQVLFHNVRKGMDIELNVPEFKDEKGNPSGIAFRYYLKGRSDFVNLPIDGRVSLSNSGETALRVEVFVPYTAAEGRHSGDVLIKDVSSGRVAAKIPVVVNVFPIDANPRLPMWLVVEKRLPIFHLAREFGFSVIIRTSFAEGLKILELSRALPKDTQIGFIMPAVDAIGIADDPMLWSRHIILFDADDVSRTLMRVKEAVQKAGGAVKLGLMKEKGIVDAVVEFAKQLPISVYLFDIGRMSSLAKKRIREQGRAVWGLYDLFARRRTVKEADARSIGYMGFYGGLEGICFNGAVIKANDPSPGRRRFKTYNRAKRDKGAFVVSKGEVHPTDYAFILRDGAEDFALLHHLERCAEQGGKEGRLAQALMRKRDIYNGSSIRASSVKRVLERRIEIFKALKGCLEVGDAR